MSIKKNIQNMTSVPPMMIQKCRIKFVIYILFNKKKEKRKIPSSKLTQQPKARDPVETEDPQRSSGFSVSLDPACTPSFYRTLPVASKAHFFSRLNRSPPHDQQKKKERICLVFTKTATDNFFHLKLPLSTQLISVCPLFSPSHQSRVSDGTRIRHDGHSTDKRGPTTCCLPLRLSLVFLEINPPATRVNQIASAHATWRTCTRWIKLGTKC